MAYTNSGLPAFVAAAALGPYVRVTADWTATPPTVSLAGPDDEAIGETEAAADAGRPVTVRLYGRIAKREVAGAVTQYARVYEAAAGRVDDALTGGPGAGVALTGASNAGERISVLEDPQRSHFSGVRAVAVADSTAITAAAEATFDNASKTLNGADLRVGDIIHVVVGVVINTTTGSETVTVRLKLGTETICTSEAPDATNGDICYIDAYIVVRELGATGKILAYGVIGNGVQGTVTAKPFRKAEATEDISGNVAITVTSEASNTGESVECECFIVDVKRK